MPAITQAQLDQLKTTLIARWNSGLKLSPEDWRKIAKVVVSNGKSNTYEWLSQFPAFREWVGSRLHKKFKENGYIVINRKFECTVDVQRTDIEDDSIGQYGTIAESAGQSATDLKNDLVYQALAAGFSSPCYDGQFFFDTDHPVYANEDGSGAAATVSNMQDGTGAPWVLLCTKRAAAPIYLQERMPAQFDSLTSTQNQTVFDLDVYSFGGRWRGEAVYGFWQCAFGSKAALTADNFNAAYAAMMKFSADGGKKLGIVPDTLVCGPDNMADAEALLKAAQNAAGASNTNYNKVGLVVTPFM
ncbi:Mu-like prophage major head subunit gpT family protein [Pandoraea apista]|uniref:Mu-like prophage FluMu major head subunit gpT n=1 Tax=Pandoraea apista TaxID=93218 RepID=A0A5E5P7B4_9BURK|nr:Mu-like prophage major head subunit gpT family protein [Pandoraea apista]AJF00055.1 Mu-like prophage FluMu major head subunit gpT [Pandoraea apista]AKH74210.1 Mu-like prophage FluMu major head subunit gpT [Pandoraea apista]AKI62759.1 Mu-like prophage FluMu major head subunit gpT [Pandoraea apista]VVG72105.1 Mu-like prophage FluMu major head subunit gpT [Pandoraea apista]